MLAIALTAGAALWLRSGMATQPVETPRELAFVNVTVVPMDGDRLLPGHTVVVRGSSMDLRAERIC